MRRKKKENEPRKRSRTLDLSLKLWGKANLRCLVRRWSRHWSRYHLNDRVQFRGSASLPVKSIRNNKGNKGDKGFGERRILFFWHSDYFEPRCSIQVLLRVDTVVFRDRQTERERRGQRRKSRAERRKAPRGQEAAGEWPCFTIRGLGHSPVILPQFGGTTEGAHISFSPQSLSLKMRLISS